MNKDIDTQFLCKDCERYNLCQYYDRRKEDSYICKYFHLSAEPQKMGRWIPVSERLPELGEKVLCQCRAGIYEVLKLTVNGWYFDIDHCYMESFVIAWMPLPEPYVPEINVGKMEESEDTE